MKNPVKNEPVMEFVFQTIKLDQVENLIPRTYRSKYENIRNQVIERIKSLPDGETFIFQPENKKAKLDDNLIARICHGINTGIIRENLNWKIAFSKKVRAFVVAPFKRYKLGKRGELKMAKPTEIAPLIKAKATPANVTDLEAEQLTHLLTLTHKHFGKTLKDLQTKSPGTQDPELANIKKAFLYVGRNAMKIKLNHIGKLLGMQSSSATRLCQLAEEPQAKEYVKVLQTAITTNGGGN